MSEGKTLKLQVWRQPQANAKGKLAEYTVTGIADDMSFLEMLDVLNEKLIRQGEDPVAYDHDCREGICGSCGFVINGVPHGPLHGTTVCQLFMRNFPDGGRIVLEPWRARAFPVTKDLVVDRTSFDRIIEKGGYVSFDAGSAPDGNAIPVSKEISDEAMDYAACIGCGACVASCKNAAAMLFVGAKVSQFALLPQGMAERERRVLQMVGQMEKEGFGACTNEAECEAVCPKEIPTKVITRLNHEYLRATLKSL